AHHHPPNAPTGDSIPLTAFADTHLQTLIKPASGHPHDAAARIGVIGVWTDAKVSFLLYELKTRLGMNQLATCSALTASASRAQHFNALSQLHKLLGIEQFDSVAEFADWLAPGAHLSLPSNVTGFQPAIEGLTLNSESMVADRAIIG